MRERGRTTSSTSREEDEDAYAEHCREADIATAPLRDCLSYYNGHGEARAGQPRLLRRRGLEAAVPGSPGDARPLRVPGLTSTDLV